MVKRGSGEFRLLARVGVAVGLALVAYGYLCRRTTVVVQAEQASAQPDVQAPGVGLPDEMDPLAPESGEEWSLPLPAEPEGGPAPAPAEEAVVATEWDLIPDAVSGALERLADGRLARTGASGPKAKCPT